MVEVQKRSNWCVPQITSRFRISRKKWNSTLLGPLKRQVNSIESPNIIQINSGKKKFRMHLRSSLFSAKTFFGQRFFRPKLFSAKDFLGQIFSAKDFFGHKIFFCAKMIFSAKKYFFLQKWFICAKLIFLCKTDFFVQNWFFCAKLIFLCKNDFFVQKWFFCAKMIFLCKNDFFGQKIFFVQKWFFWAKKYFYVKKTFWAKKYFYVKKTFGQIFSVKNFLKKVGDPSGRPLWGLRLHFTQISFQNVTQEKIPNPSYIRRSP